ncbi:hypothetical protein BBP40_000564 [Aspergillus hancockii]|nr:hypothetical protein BBP40_000564 [Aspergillus hancockii]
MGLWVTGEETTRHAAIDLHEKLTSTIYHQRDGWDISNRPATSETASPWPMATYQGILLQIIFALIKGDRGHVDLHLTHELPEIPAQLLVALVQSCRNRNMFFYPAMLAEFNLISVPNVYIWVGIEEAKRYALALYKVCRQCRVLGPMPLGESLNSISERGTYSQGRSLLSLADLHFALPDSNELWDASSDLAARLAENPDDLINKNIEENWISQTARLLQPNNGAFNWI